MSFESQLEDIKDKALVDIEGCASTKDLEAVRVAFLGKKGRLTTVLKLVGSLSDEERPRAGRLANDSRRAIEEAIEVRGQELMMAESRHQLVMEDIDISLPSRAPALGSSHLLTQVIEEILEVFIELGYSVAEGPEIETDWHNFEALNTPADHPARSLQDSFYVKGGGGQAELLRTHTSPVQIRVMEERKPPLYVVCPGKAFRRDVADPSHTPMFHQVEGLAVDKDITFGGLRGTLDLFVHRIFGPERKVRLRPHFFPFTEPSAEVDVSCGMCDGAGCRTCGGQGWLEILGCGMVDPNVFASVGIDSEEFTGFAFGMGVERIAMLKYGIEDIRTFFENDVRFLRQFRRA